MQVQSHMFNRFAVRSGSPFEWTRTLDIVVKCCPGPKMKLQMRVVLLVLVLVLVLIMGTSKMRHHHILNRQYILTIIGRGGLEIERIKKSRFTNIKDSLQIKHITFCIHMML
jgi:hypothetical protein